MSDHTWKQRRKNNFENAKAQCLGKRDKSSAGRIDPHAVDICGLINERDDCYTTSSCSGRCYMYIGSGIKSTTTFRRFRISHDKIEDYSRYFDLSTIETDPSGGGDPIRTIGQYDYKIESQEKSLDDSTIQVISDSLSPEPIPPDAADGTIWLRFEPFILHVACLSLDVANALLAAARPAFKNVGLTTWKDSRYLVAIWGDEGLEMPLCSPTGQVFHDNPIWLAQLVNERHQRNWNKIDRFTTNVREMPFTIEEDTVDPSEVLMIDNAKIPKSYDVIGDIAYLHSMPDGDASQVGEAILKKNKSIKVVVARLVTLEGPERAPGSEGLRTIAGPDRFPLLTTHTEYGIKCVVDLNHTFFSPRMGRERIRICQQVARGENVLVLFAGVAMDALQIAGRTEASSVIAIEINEVAIQCARRAHRMLERNKAVKCPGAAERLEIIQGDVLEVLPKLLDHQKFDRILAPRPKEGALDGDLGTGDGGEIFLNAMLPHMRNGTECHWYDFVADHETPTCERTRKLIRSVCDRHGFAMDVLHIANVGSVAMRQLRICLDFRVSKKDC